MPPVETTSENQEVTNVTDEATQKPDDLGNLANAAAKSHISRFTEKVLPSLFAQALKPLQDEIASLKAPKVEVVDDKKSKTSPELAAMQAQLEEFKSKYAASEQARVAAEQKSRDDRAHSALKAELATHVRPELLNVLADNLYHMRKVVDFDEEGNPLFKTKKPDMFGDLEEVRMPLKDGVSHFLKSDEAKAFLPAPSSGAGSAPLKKPGSRSVTAFDPATASEADKIRHSMEIVQRAQSKGMT